MRERTKPKQRKTGAKSTNEERSTASMLRVSDIAATLRVHRSTVYRYLDLGLIEAAGRDGKHQYFTDTQVKILRLIDRLRGDLFRFKLMDIRYRIIPEFSEAELARLADQSTETVKRILRQKGIPC